MRAFLSCLPALLAAVLIAVSPGCASVRHADREPCETTVETRPPDYIGGIERGAGQIISENDVGELYLIAAWVAIGIVGGLVWAIYLLVELIIESLDMPYEEVISMLENEGVKLSG